MSAADSGDRTQPLKSKTTWLQDYTVKRGASTEASLAFPEVSLWNIVEHSYDELSEEGGGINEEDSIHEEYSIEEEGDDEGDDEEGDDEYASEEYSGRDMLSRNE